ncbi:ABC transporter ATP-binding protein [Candidatus Amarolinea dominans]|uniref:ABC transporter ATP-binding protein n=1 Tax=Candidatus Amarolinea dominans TaxID=3140696 RepID=UPI001DEA32A3|nr:ABC transporter ATP-binding protein [Anaerolineae bacterium]
MAPVIEVSQVNKVFGEQVALRDVSLRVEPGEIFCLLGPSGSGKTTLIRLLNGVYFPTQGRVTVFGKEPARFSRQDREQIGYMPQMFVLYPNLSVAENLNFIASIYGLSWHDRRQRLPRLLELVNLTEHQRSLAGNISGGMKRRLELACALLHEPALVYMDEPTAGIDPILRASLWKEFRSLRDEERIGPQGESLGRRTLFVTTQYVNEADSCDKVAIVAKGELVALGTPQELRAQALGGEAIEITADRMTRQHMTILQDLPGVKGIERLKFDQLRIAVDDAQTRLPLIVQTLYEQGLDLDSVDIVELKFDEVFVRLIEQHEKEKQG